MLRKHRLSCYSQMLVKVTNAGPSKIYFALTAMPLFPRVLTFQTYAILSQMEGGNFHTKTD